MGYYEQKTHKPWLDKLSADYFIKDHKPNCSRYEIHVK